MRELNLMPFEKANAAAGAHLMSGATLQELKAAASDLRALSRTSALADLVDAKIAAIQSKRDPDVPEDARRIGTTPEA